MRKKLIKSILVTSFLAMMLYACQKEYEELSNNRDFSVEEARVWYEAHKPEYIELKSGGKDKKVKYIKPDWSRSIRFENKEEEIVETEIQTNGGFGFALEDMHGQWERTRNDRYMRSHTKLVVIKNKKTKTEIGCFMTIIGDKSYTERKNLDTDCNRYRKPEDDFSGVILFHNLDGGFSNGWRYTDGRLTHVSTISFEEIDSIELKSAFYCKTEPFYYWDVVCNYYYYVTSVDGVVIDMEYSYMTCNSVQVYAGSITNCSEISGGGGQPTGGGGYTGVQSNVSPRPYSVKQGDKFAKSNMNQNMSSQILNSCFISIMHYMNQEFCHGSKDINYYNNDYHERYGKWALLVGVDSEKSYEFLSKHFKIHYALNYVYAIDAGHIIMTDIKTSDPSITHAVAVIGYHPDNTLIYMDPFDGSLKEASSSYFNASYAYEVSYCLELIE